MVLIAAATCKDEHELNDLRMKLQKVSIRPEIVGLNVHIEYEPSASATKFEVDSISNAIINAFEVIDTHGITRIP